MTKLQSAIHADLNFIERSKTMTTDEPVLGAIAASLEKLLSSPADALETKGAPPRIGELDAALGCLESGAARLLLGTLRMDTARALAMAGRMARSATQKNCPEFCIIVQAMVGSNVADPKFVHVTASK